MGCSCTQSETHHSTNRNPIDILLIDDNVGDIRLTKEALNETGIDHSLKTFSDGENALDHLLEDNPQSFPDLILLDFHLPGKNGNEILKTIREDHRLQHLPVIILTSSEAKEDILQCYEAAANAYLTKPTKYTDLISMMEAVEEFWIKQVQLPSNQ
ncbi:response regulator [Natrialba aegyptia]|uniref:Response regulator receiver protein n=1 Tax=Natrialba aegyptia DSM 13077 TaxID=1227491 RepID=M0ANS5_9EURY|nr:response regulator [Natrialba aegyptia]ELY99582.1 response regulator receiver protein [Natrialba aegyptia DSM 13077]